MLKLPEKELLRPDEVAEYFSVHVRTIYNWILEDKLEAVKIARFTRIRRDSVKNMEKPIDMS